jgi:ribosomal protein S18 acetylase RimI-like enzyme
VRITVRAFDGSLSDAEGLLTIERATFNESPYDANQVRALLVDGPQRAWLALADDDIVGFVVAFPTRGLSGASWEVDLLAVHADWAGRGLATRLIRAAGAYGVGLCRRARAVVATDNAASMGAFKRAGFRPISTTYRLLIYRISGLSPPPPADPAVTIREATSLHDAADWLVDAPSGPDYLDLNLLLAQVEGQPAGFAELIEVQTILYRGLWIEALETSAQSVRQAMVHRVIDKARAAGLDEVGAMVPHHNSPLQRTLLAAGFRSLGDFRWLVAELPLPVAMQQDHV